MSGATDSYSARRAERARSRTRFAAEAPAEAPACRVARSSEELDDHFAIRRRVFCDEQCIFAGTDHDAIDDDPATLHVIAAAGERAGGTVRLYPLDDDGLWQGDRLAVLREFRHGFIGAELVRFAVATAGELGGHRMNAMIQPQNVRFFESLGWSRAGEVTLYHGVEHQPMSIALSRRFQ